MKSVLFFTFSLILCSNFEFRQSAKLDEKEVKVLKQLGEKLGIAGKKEWDLDTDPCSGEGNWGRGEYRKGFEVSVNCDCSFDRNATCRVIRIALKSQNISTAIPSEFSKLRYLKTLDLSRNCLNGTVPPQWAPMRLVDLSLMGNRLSGQFPRVLTRITTLVNLSMEGNRFSGSIPQEIGNMKSLEKLY